MKNFVWKGRTRAGKSQSGVISANTKEEVIEILRKQKIIVTSVKPKAKEIKLPTLGSGVKKEELGVFTRQLSVMIDAGLPIVQCLEILASSQVNKRFQEILYKVKASVEEGMTFADSLRKHPKVFDALYTNLIEAGETGGIMDTILQRLSTYIEKSVTLKRQVKSAMTYPAVIISIAVVVVIILMIWVIPTFAMIFTGLGSELPGMTMFVINLSHFVKDYILIIIAVAIGIGVLIYYYYQTKNGRFFIDKLMLNAPVIGELVRKIVIARFTRTLGTLISSGVSILDALEITARTAGNAIIEKAIMDTRESISEGKSISEPLRETDQFPPMVVSMIGVGEQTGALDTMLQKIADFYEEEVDVAVANLTSLMEPLMIVVLGTIIGFIVIAMYMPQFKLIGEMAAK